LEGIDKDCGALVGSLSRNMKHDAEWQVEALGRIQEAAFVPNTSCLGDPGVSKDPLHEYLPANQRSRS